MSKVPGKQINPTFRDDVTGPNGYFDGELRAEIKQFEIKHPTLEGKVLVHTCLEGPENGVYARGKSHTTTVAFPDYWEHLVREDTITVHITPFDTIEYYTIVSVDTSGFVVVNRSNISSHAASFFWIAYATRKDVPMLDVVQDKRPDPVDDESID